MLATLPLPHARATAVLGDEDDTGGFKSRTDRPDGPVSELITSLKANDGVMTYAGSLAADASRADHRDHRGHQAHSLPVTARIRRTS